MDPKASTPSHDRTTTRVEPRAGCGCSLPALASPCCLPPPVEHCERKCSESQLTYTAGSLFAVLSPGVRGLDLSGPHFKRTNDGATQAIATGLGRLLLRTGRTDRQDRRDARRAARAPPCRAAQASALHRPEGAVLACLWSPLSMLPLKCPQRLHCACADRCSAAARCSTCTRAW